MARSTKGLNPDLDSAFRAAQRDLADQGVTLSIHDAVRSEGEQAHLRARKGKMAARPGPHAPHVAGNALDLRASAGMRDARVVSALKKHGLAAPVKGEPWHWELSARVLISERNDADAFLDATSPRKKTGGADAFLDATTPKTAPKSTAGNADAFLDATAPKAAPKAKWKPIFERFPPPAATSTPTSKLPLADIKGYPSPQKKKFSSFREQEEAAAEFRSSYYSAPRPKGVPEPLTQKMTPKQTGAVQGGVQKAINFVSSPLFPVREIVNRMAGENAKFKAKHPDWRSYKGKQLEDYNAGRRASILRGLENSRPWQRFVAGLKGQDTPFEPFQLAAKHNPEFRKSLKVAGVNISPAILDFAASFPVDALTGKAQGRVVEALVSKAGKPLLATAEKIPAVGRYAEKKRAFKTTQSTVARSHATAERDTFEVADIAEDVKRVTKREKKKGATVRTVDKLTKAPVNEVSRLAADYVEAGAKGSRHAAPAPPRISIAAMGLGPKAAAAVRGGIEASGAFTDRVLNSARTVGRAKLDELVEAGSITTTPPAKAPTLPRAGQRLPPVKAEQLPQDLPLEQGQVPGEFMDRVLESARGAGRKRVDDLTQGTAPTEAQVPVWAERAAAAKRRTEELPKVQAESEALGIDYAEVARLGERYRALADKMGQEMSDLGLISTEAYETLRGQYLPRLYMMSSGSPKEAERWLKALEDAGEIEPDAALFVRERLRMREKARAHGADDPTSHRTIEEFGERVRPEIARIASPEATPAFSRYAAHASREIGEARAWKELAETRPDLLVKKSGVTGATAPRGWTGDKAPVKIGGEEYYVHPGVAQFIDVRERLQAQQNWGPQWYRTMNKSLRRWWISAPRTATNNAVGNYTLGKGAAEVNNAGSHYTLSSYLEMRSQFMAGKKGTVSPRLQEARDSGIISEGSSVLPAETRKLGAGFGVETPLERLKATPGEFLKFETPAQQAYSTAIYGDVEKVSRLHLFDALRKSGKSATEAARITEAAMINYSDISPLLAWLDRGNVFPFATFPVKAIWQYANMGARRPDLFQSFTGERLRDVSDALADEANPNARAKEKREQGKVSLMELPIPGRKDAMGQQVYRRVPLAAPILQMFPANPDADVISERIKSIAPAVRVPLEIATNRNTYTGKPIVDPGLAPSASGKFGAYALHVAKALVPEVVDGESFYHALTQTSPYASAYASKQETGDVLMRLLTGITAREGAGDTSRQGTLRAKARMKSSEHVPHRAYYREVVRALRSERIAVNPKYGEQVRSYRELHTAKAQLFSSFESLKRLLTTDEKSGIDRKRALENQAHFVFALKKRIVELKAEERATPPLVPDPAAAGGAGVEVPAPGSY
ncbi:MAG: hypothetical protein H0X07_00130 [Gemmatimonadales bacterium]|nr:hypothetical protein [Gemmatimonadales bacterium]